MKKYCRHNWYIQPGNRNDKEYVNFQHCVKCHKVRVENHNYGRPYPMTAADKRFWGFSEM